MRQTKLLLATIAMLWCSLTASAHDFAVGGIYYNITSETDLTVEVTYQGSYDDEYSNEYSGAVTIPSAVTYNGKTYSVTEIGFAAFAYCSNLTVLNIPESITGIGSAAFFLCSSLTTINIPKGVMTIESQTFCGCSSLISITIPEGVTSIGMHAFYNCSSLTSITIPESVTSIGSSAFSGCTSLTSITIPESSQLTIIGYEAFRDCSSLTSITIPESVTSIGGYAFHGTAWYDNQPDGVIYIDKVLYTYKGTMPANTSIEVKEGTEYIANQAFNGCSSLTAINIPESVTSIEDDAFSGCSSLTAIIVEEDNTTYDSRDNCNAIIETSSNCLIVGCSATIIPESVTSIGNYAFSGCSSLTSITIPESVTSIGPYAFYGTAWYDNQPDGVIYINKVLYTYKGTMPANTSIEVKEGTASITSSAFFGCSSLTSITIPESVTSIGEYAFRDCNSLTAINIPEGVKSIGNSAFEGCSSLTAINIPESVTEIGSSAFYRCYSLTAITIPESVTEIGDYAFYECSSLTAITIPESSQLTSIGGYAFYGCSSLTAITIPGSVTSIGSSAFYRCYSLTAITIPESVTEIGDYAFYECIRLTSITIPEGVKSIGNDAFYNCIRLYTVINCSNLGISKGSTAYGYVAYYAEKVLNGSNLSTVGDYQFYTSNGVHYLANYSGNDSNLVLPDSYNGENYRIADNAFRGCHSLTSITIPESVMGIGDYAFYGCNSLTAINIPENSQLTSIGDYAFDSCSNLTTITIPESVKSIGYRAFHVCHGLTAITIPENSQLTSIGDQAFYRCYSLTSITIPESVTSIGNYAFYGCSSLTSITIPKSVTSIGNYAFYDCNSLYTVINCSNLGISKGSTAYGYVAYYAEEVVNVNGLNAAYQFYTSNGVHYLASYSGNDSNLILPDSYNGENYKIDDYAFSGCSSLTSITIPESVTSIGNKTFEGCTSLKELVIADGGETLSLGYNMYDYYGTGEGLFYDCPLETIYLGRNLSYSSGTRYGYSPFYGQKALTSVTIGESVTSIGMWAFSGCSSLTSIIVEGSNTTYDSRDNCNAIIETSGNCLIAGCSATIIPESVTSIGDYAFRDCTSLTSITIPESVTSIGSSAFWNCSSLYKVINCSNLGISKGSTAYGYVAYYAEKVLNGSNLSTVGDYQFYTSNGVHYLANYSGNDSNLVLPDSYNGENYKIDDYAFYGCSSLTSITIPERVTSIGSYAFFGCRNLSSITIPESVTSIGKSAFNGCTSLKELVIADGSETLSLDYNSYNYDGVGEGLFYDCPLETIYLGRNLSYSSGTRYGYSPFYGQKALTSVTIGESVTSIGMWAFSGCSSLTSITIPEGVTSIGQRAFSYCSNLTSITIPEGVTRIVSEAFYGCSSLTSITIPESVTSIGEYAFYYCSNLTSITIPENSELRSIEKSAFSGCSRLTAIIIPEGVTSIEDFAFDGCTSLKELVIKDGSKTLSLGYTKYNSKGKGLFYDCPLETIFLGRNLSYINNYEYGYSPFYNQNALTSVTIGESVTSIGKSAFENCSRLTSITIPEGVTSIGEYAFYNCSSLTAVHIKDIASWCNIDFSGYNANPLYYAKNLYLNGELVTELTIPHTVTAIKRYAFYNCSNLTSITIPESVTSIGYEAFLGCGGELTINCNIPSASQYDYGVFYKSKFTKVTIGEGVTSIGKYAFYGCSSLTSVTIPESVTSIGKYAFYYCSSLTAVHIKDIAFWCNINFSGYNANPLYYAKNLYLNGELVTELTIPNTATAIKDYAFYDYSNLTSIIIPESVTSIGDNAFIGCSNVENLVVKGSAMPHVPSDKLKKIVLYSPAPLQSKGFSATVYQNCMLYVPQQGLARYQIVEPWAYFWNIIAFDTSDIAPAELPEDDSDPIIYDLRGQRVDVPTRGNIYIVNGRKVLY